MFDQLKAGIQQFVDFIIELVDMIKEFVAGFKTEIVIPSIPESHFNGEAL